MGALNGRAMRVATGAFGLAMLASPSSARRAPAAAPSTCAVYAPEAAARSGLPVEIIVRVMTAESGGDPRAISPKGAIGCMQIMPATWAYLTARYALGSDPFDPRMNMIGGALYLAELKQQLGFPGAFAAYNAGAARYGQFVATGRPLPSETTAYVGRLSGSARPFAIAPAQARWQDAALFLARGERQTAAEPVALESPSQPIAPVLASAPIAPERAVPARQSLFPLTGSGPSTSH